MGWGRVLHAWFDSVGVRRDDRPLGRPADDPSPSQTAQGDIAVTIYNNNRALIEDKRQLDLPAGRSRQEFRDVSAQIEPATVTLNGRGIGIVEQNFDFDLLSPAALMQKAHPRRTGRGFRRDVVNSPTRLRNSRRHAE